MQSMYSQSSQIECSGLLSPFLSEEEALHPREIYKKVSPCVFQVFAEDKENEEADDCYGSAVLIGTDLLVTCHHVVQDRETITVMGRNLKEFEAEVIRTDEERDLAFLRADKDFSEFIELGSIDGISIGDYVYAVGSPSGYTNTLTEGLISNLLDLDGTKMIQTTAAMSKGSSGGALVDQYGRLVGITALGILGDSGMINFAIPSIYVGELELD